MAEKRFAWVGKELDKVGRSSGWTFGRVIATCVDFFEVGGIRTLLCQDILESVDGSVIVSPGDSGAAIFKWRSSGEVDLNGILWGGTISGTQLIFSPFRSIEWENGNLTTIF